MILSKIFLVMLTFFLYSIVLAQSTYTEKDKNNFYTGIFNGCLDKQNQGDANKALKEGMTAEVCTCLAENSTSNIFGDMDFQIALSRNDKLSAKKIIDKNLSSENVLDMFNNCIKKLEKKYSSKELFSENNVKLSEKIGLTGESRNSFVNSGVATCMTEKSGYGKDIDKKYCSCYMNYMADRISQKDLVDMGKKTAKIMSKSAELREKGVDNCIPIFR